MSNFEYIISSLPFLTADYKYAEGEGFLAVVGQIREDLSGKDGEALDFLLTGFDADQLNPDFYARALAHPLTSLLDKLFVGEEEPVASALAQDSLLGREKALDDVIWEKISSLETFHYFDLTAVLAYVAKLHIVDRWLALDEQKGRELFRQLVQEVRGTFQGVQYTDK